jgi:hypothetical protein
MSRNGCCRLSAIDPDPARATASLKTRMVKKELAATANCSVSVSPRGRDSVQRLRSRSIVTLPFRQSSFEASASALTFGHSFVAPKAFGRSPAADAKSRKQRERETGER